MTTVYVTGEIAGTLLFMVKKAPKLVTATGTLHHKTL